MFFFNLFDLCIKKKKQSESSYSTSDSSDDSDDDDSDDDDDDGESDSDDGAKLMITGQSEASEDSSDLMETSSSSASSTTTGMGETGTLASLESVQSEVDPSMLLTTEMEDALGVPKPKKPISLTLAKSRSEDEAGKVLNKAICIDTWNFCYYYYFYYFLCCCFYGY
jgi:hypothetical protein